MKKTEASMSNVLGTKNCHQHLLRRSSRRAAIDRRVWAEPRKCKKSSYTHKNIKQRKASRIVKSALDKITDVRKISNLQALTSSKDKQDGHSNRLHSRVGSIWDSDKISSIDSHLEDKSGSECPPYDDSSEGTLITDCDLSSLQAAVIEEIIGDVPNGDFTSETVTQELCFQSSGTSPCFKTNENYPQDSVIEHSCKEQSSPIDDCGLKYQNSNEELTANITSNANLETYKKKNRNIRCFNTRKKFKRGTDRMALTMRIMNSNGQSKFDGKASKPILIDKKVNKPILSDRTVGKPILSDTKFSKPILNYTKVSKTILSDTKVSRPILNDTKVSKRNFIDTKFGKPILIDTKVSSDTKANSETLLNDDSPVSLSEALAKLIDSDDSGPDPSNQTVTIHPVANSETNINGQIVKCALETYEKMTPFKMKKSEYEGNEKVDCTSTEIRKSPPLFGKSTSKSPGIKIPLKCSECQMRFCTVRSLLWHFGSHEPGKNDVVSDTNLLQDLLTSWDNPQVPMNISDGNIKDDITRTISYDSDSKLVNQEDCIKSNGDFILKIPVPKLNYIKTREAGSPKKWSPDSFVKASGTLFPQPSIAGQPAKQFNISSYNEIDILPCYGKNPLPLPNERISKPCTSKEILSSLTFNGNNRSTTSNLFSSEVPTTSFSSGVPITSFSSETVSKYSLSSPIFSLSALPKVKPKETNSFTVVPQSNKELSIIPVQNLGKHTKLNYLKNGHLDAEKDGVVMINKTLGVRIVSSVGDSKLDENLMANCSDSLTIYPQTNSFDGFNTRHCKELAPDILTIVPQKDSKKYCKKNNSQVVPHLITATGKVTPDSSKVVQLVLLPQKLPKNKLMKKHNSFSKCTSNSEQLKREVTKVKTTKGESDEESEDGMVIDVEEESGECRMDPLSLCAVTMDEESGGQNQPPNEVRPSSEEHDSPTTFHVKVFDEKYLQRKYVCQFCQKRFGWSTDLKRHIILHTGERPFKCKWCPITFTRKFLLQNHMKKIHSQVCKWSDLWE